jgi:hypothetical protein
MIMEDEYGENHVYDHDNYQLSSDMCLHMSFDSGYSYWIWDTACPVQICNDINCYTTDLRDSSYRLRVADQTPYNSGGVGTAATIQDVHYFANFGANLCSQSYCRDNNWSIVYDIEEDVFRAKAPYMSDYLDFKRDGKYYIAKIRISMDSVGAIGYGDPTTVQQSPTKSM